MVYLMLEILMCVFALMVMATLAFILCVTVLLVREALTQLFRTIQKAGGELSQWVDGARSHALIQ
jgi:hypothetical protein